MINYISAENGKPTIAAKLGIDMLKDMPPHSIFATGVMVDSPEGINLSNSGEMLRWVAVRGGIHDWAVYAHFSHHDENWIQKHGDKVTSTNNIKKLVPCTDEAFGMYRY